MTGFNSHLHHFVSSLPVRRDVAYCKHTAMFSSLKRWEFCNKDVEDVIALSGRMAFLVSNGSGKYAQRTVLRQEAQRMQPKEGLSHTIRCGRSNISDIAAVSTLVAGTTARL